jgi:branched-chain amino acid transport system permease protein
MIMMVVIGGSGTIIGPLLGALWLQFTSDYLRETFTNFHTIILGVIIIVAVILIPQGAVNFLREGRRTKQYSLLSNVRKYRL